MPVTKKNRWSPLAKRGCHGSRTSKPQEPPRHRFTRGCRVRGRSSICLLRLWAKAASRATQEPRSIFGFCIFKHFESSVTMIISFKVTRFQMNLQPRLQWHCLASMSKCNTGSTKNTTFSPLLLALRQKCCRFSAPAKNLAGPAFGRDKENRQSIVATNLGEGSMGA